MVIRRTSTANSCATTESASFLARALNRRIVSLKACSYSLFAMLCNTEAHIWPIKSIVSGANLKRGGSRFGYLGDDQSQRVRLRRIACSGGLLVCGCVVVVCCLFKL